MALDVLALPELPDGDPAGPDLEYDADFAEMRRAAQGKAESQFGSTVEAAVPPEWKEVERCALSLLARTRDLRVLSHLAIARLHLEGLPGYAEVLTGVRTLLETQWENVHPQLDPEDDLDPMGRASALSMLTDPGNVLRPLRDTPLAGSVRTGGAVSWRDIAVLNGSVEPEEGKPKRTEADVRNAFVKTDAGRRQVMLDAAARAVDEVAKIAAAFNARRAGGDAFDFSVEIRRGEKERVLPKLLAEIHKDLVRFEPPPDAPSEEGPDQADAAGADGGTEIRPAAPAPAARGFASVTSITAVHKRDEALYLLDLASAYFRQYEPSSPLPLLIDRARRLSSLGFMEILKDLAPDGLNQAQVVAGPQDAGSGEEQPNRW